MNAITTGTGLGLYNTSLDLLGGSGGSAQLGRTGERVYVNAATGNLVVQAQDEYLASLGLDLGLVRTYNAQGQWTDDNGDNWRLNIASLCGLAGTLNTAGSTITKVFGDGAEVTYTYDDARGLYLASAGDGAHDTLTFNSATQEWTWTDGSSRSTEIFNAAGQLIARRDLDGNTTSYQYTGSLLTQITDASGQVTELVYSGANLTEIRTHSQGLTQTRVRYGYDSLNRLTEVIVDLSPENGSISDGNTYVTRYTYDGTSTRIAAITQGDGSQVAFTYVEIDGQWKIKTVTDGDGHATRYDYDAINRETTVTDPLGATTRYRYDAEGRLTILTDATGAATTYGYDADGNLESLLNANGEAIAFRYDTNGNLIFKRDATGNTVTYTYGTRNELLTETVYLVNDPDGAGPGAPSEPRTTRYVYDSEGHLRFGVSAEGRVRESRYDASGNRLTTIAYRSGDYDLTGLSPTDTVSEAQLQAWASSQDLIQTERSDYAYDFRGQVAAVTTYATIASTGQGIADGTHSVTRFVYDQTGRLLETIEARGEATADPSDYRTTYTYDGLGRLLATHQWVSATETRTTVTAYDDLNQRLTTTLANGLATTQVFDRAGRLVSVSQADTTQALGTTTYTYDAAGNLRITTDPTGQSTYALYDVAGRPVATIDATGAVSETVYDAAGRAVKTIRYATALTVAQVTSLVDGNGNPANVALGSIRPPASADDRIGYTLYDQAGRAVMTIAPHDTDPAQGYVTQRFYDGAGRVTDVIEYASPLSLAGLPALPTPDDVVPHLLPSEEDRHSRTFYDDDGMVLASLDAAGTLTRYRYGSSGRLDVSITFAVAVDPMLHAGGDLATLVGSISAQTGGDHSGDLYTWYFHNNKGELTGVLDAESYLTEYRYDAAGNEIERIRYASRTAPYAAVAPTQERLNEVRPAPSANDRIALTSYNGANQVVSVTVLPENTVTAHTYDAVGNLIRTDRAWNSAEVRTTRARYDAQGRLVQELSGEGSAALEVLLARNPNASQEEIDTLWSQWGIAHGYDTAGRRTSTTDQNGHVTLFYYDAASRLAYTVNALGEVTHNVYNALGQLIDTTRYSNRIDTAGLGGGLVTPELELRVQAIARPEGANPDARTRYNYTLRGAVREAIYGPGSATEGRTAYAYNAFGERIAETVRLDSATSRLTEHRYDRAGRLTGTIEDVGGLERTTRSEYDAFGRLLRTHDARGNATDYGYDRIGRRVTVTTADGTRTTTYDAFARVLTHTDALNHTTTYTYDDANQRFTVRTPEGIETTTETNRHGETVAVTDGNGNTTRYAYDRNGQLTQVTQAEGALDLTTSGTYDRAGLKLTSTDANGAVTEYDYDAANRLVLRTIDPTGLALSTRYSYDGQGRVLTTTDANGTVTRTEYDAKGQVTSVTVDPSGLHLTTTYTYDAEGKTLTVTEGAGTAEARTTEYRYDTLGRRIAEIKDPSNSATGHNGLNLTTTYVYDPNGNLIAKTEGEGTAEARTTRYIYDANNRLTDTVDAMGAVTHRDYDVAGNLIRTVAYATAIDLTGLTTISAADLAARLTASPTDRTTGYAYDTDGRLVYTVNSLGHVTEARYDANGNVVTQIAYATAIPTTTTNTQEAIAQALSLIADPTRDHLQHTVYDAANRATFHLDALNQVIERTYDANGNVIKTTAYATAISLPATVTDATVRTAVSLIANPGQDHTSRTVYDAAHRAVYGIDALGYVTETHYDPTGWVRETVAYYDAIDLAALGASPTPADLTAALAARSLVQAEQDQHTAYEYDAAGRLTSTTDAEGYTEHYQYDVVGNKIAFTNKKGTYAGDPQYTWHYAYDAANRLIEETTPAVEVTRLSENADSTITPVTTTEPVVTRIAYDAHGNVIARTEAYGTPNQRTTEYRYDAAGRQVQTIMPPIAVYDVAQDNLLTNGVLADHSAEIEETYWVQNGDLVTSRNGLSITVDPSFYADRTPTSVKASIYNSNGDLVRTETTDVGNSSAGYWNAVSNWNGQVNLSPTSLKPDTYRVVVEIRDDATMGRVDGRFYDGTDGTWVRTHTVYLTVGTVFTAIERTEVVVKPTTITYYDAFGQACANRDARGSFSYKIYDGAGRVAYEIDAERYVTAYRYDAFGNQIAVTRHAQVLSETVFAAREQQAGDQYVQGFSQSDVQALLATIADVSRDRILTNSFDALNRLTETRQPATYGYDSSAPAGQQYFTAAPTTRNEYNAFGQLVKQSSLKNPLTSEWIDGYFYYNVRGQKTAEINALGYVTAYQYDGAGNLVSQTEYARALTAGSWGVAGHAPPPLTTPDTLPGSPAGYDRIRAFGYDRLGRLISETAIGVDYQSVDYALAPLTVQDRRGDVTTRYAFDALGNRISVTDPAGAVTYSYYDALGRTRAVVSPARVDANGVKVAPLTTFHADIFGNVVHQVSHAAGGVVANSASYSAGAASAEDQHRYMMLDAHGQVRRSMDAEGASTYFAYDAAGNVAKSWQSLVDADWAKQNKVVQYGYDRLGRQITATEVLRGSTAGAFYGQHLSVTRSEHNAFGELVARTSGARREFFDYDAAGRLWRTNQQDGVIKVYLYNLQGQATAEIRSQGRDLGDAVYATPGSVASLIWDVVRTDTRYDALGRATVQTAAEVEQARAASAAPSVLAVHEGFVSLKWDAANPAGGDYNNNIDLNWGLIESWGDGDLIVTVQYTVTNAAGSVVTKNCTRRLGADAKETSITWNPFADPAAAVDYGYVLKSIERIRVAKLVDGVEALVYDQPGSGFAREVQWLKPALTDVKAVLQYRAAGTGEWMQASTGSGTIVDRGNSYAVSLLSLPSDQYEFVLRYYLTGESQPFSESRGTFMLADTNTAGSVNVVGRAELPWLYETIAVNANILGEVNNRIDLAWGSLERWGSGDVVVTIDFVNRDRWYGGDGVAASVTATFGALGAEHGAKVSWSDNAAERYGGVQHISRIRVWKLVDGIKSLVHDTGGDYVGDRRLLLSGDTAGLTAVSIAGVGTRAVKALGGGIFAVNIDDLPAGTYVATPIGTQSSRSFEFAAAGAKGRAVLSDTADDGTIRAVTTQALDRWGNVISVTDARGYTTEYRYSYLNQVTEEVKPWTWVWGSDGTATVERPDTAYGYDIAGRIVSTRDARGVASTLQYNAAGQKVAEHNPDSSLVQYSYDLFGQQVRKVDGNGNVTRFEHDHENRVTAIYRSGGTAAVATYAYDQAGNRIRETNGAGETTRFFYDTRGNVVRLRRPLGSENSAAFDDRGNKVKERWSGTSDSMTWQYDGFGRLTGHRDLGMATYSYGYNYLGALTHQTNTRGQNQYYDYLKNGQLAAIRDIGTGLVERYEYDIAGNRVRDTVLRNGAYFADSHIAYDALGRIGQVRESRYYDSGGFGGYDLKYSYDAVGNRRRAYARYEGEHGGTAAQDNWYAYDAMNRIVVSQGSLVDGRIVITESQGTELSYDAGGNRRMAVSYRENSAGVRYRSRETYIYDARDQLIEWRNEHASGRTVGDTTETKYYDAAGRVVQTYRYNYFNGLTRKGTVTYNDDGLVSQSVSWDYVSEVINTTNNTYDGRGNLTQSQVLVNTAGGSYVDLVVTYAYEYLKYDSYKESKVTGINSNGYGGVTTETYDVNGNLIKVVDAFATEGRNRSFALNSAGQIIRKIQDGKTQNYYYANFNSIGSNGAVTKANFDYNYTPVSESYPGMSPGNYIVAKGDTLQSIALGVYGDASLWYLIADANGLGSDDDLREGMQIKIPNEVTNVHNNADTFKPYDPSEIVGSTTPTIAPPKEGGCGVIGMIIMIVVAIVVTIFTAGAGLALVGAASSVSAGMTAVASGAMLSTLAGAGFGAVAAGSLAVGIGAVASAFGSIASQLAGMATGNVQEFSWGQVASSALTGGITAGIGTGGVAGAIGEKFPSLAGVMSNSFVNGFVNGAANGIISQGVNMLTGQQKKFSWANVAAGAVAGAITTRISSGETVSASTTTQSVGDYLTNRISGAVGGTILRSIVTHNGGPEWAAVIADDFGNALGNSVVRGIVSEVKANKKVAKQDVTNGVVGSDLINSTIATTPAAHNYTAQSGDTVWGLTGGDAELIGEFRRLNGLSDADVIYAGKEYIVPTQAQDPAAARASFEQQAALWEAKDVAVQRAAEAQTGRLGMTPGHDYDSYGYGSIGNGPEPSFSKRAFEYIDQAWGGRFRYSGARDGLAALWNGVVDTANLLVAAGPAGKQLSAQGESAVALFDPLKVGYSNPTTGLQSEALLALISGVVGIERRVVGAVANTAITEQTASAATGLSRSRVVAPETVERYLIEDMDWGPARAKGYVDSFEGPITARISRPGEEYLRYLNGPEGSGNFLTRSEFFSPVDARKGLALDPNASYTLNPNLATSRQVVTTNQRSIVFEGAVKNGGVDVRQTVITDTNRFLFGPGYRYY